MKITSHLDKFRRMTDLLTRLDPINDFGLWYWTSLTAGTTAYNASLHLTGVTREETVFSTIPGVHVVPQEDGTYARELRGPGDVSHVSWPAIPGPLPQELVDMEAALHTLEQHRDPCLRGYREPTAEIVTECVNSLASVTSILEALTERRRR